MDVDNDTKVKERKNVGEVWM